MLLSAGILGSLDSAMASPKTKVHSSPSYAIGGPYFHSLQDKPMATGVIDLLDLETFMEIWQKFDHIIVTSILRLEDNDTFPHPQWASASLASHSSPKPFWARTN